ncbi:MAG: hypothetical protein AAGH60_05250 [Pseudomonadota bacterium]
MRDPYSVFQTDQSAEHNAEESRPHWLNLIGRALEGVALVALFFALIMTLATSGARADAALLAQATQAHSSGLIAIVAILFLAMAMGLRQMWRITVKGINRAEDGRP